MYVFNESQYMLLSELNWIGEYTRLGLVVYEKHGKLYEVMYKQFKEIPVAVAVRQLLNAGYSGADIVEKLGHLMERV